jgi:hypothetical protein
VKEGQQKTFVRSTIADTRQETAFEGPDRLSVYVYGVNQSGQWKEGDQLPVRVTAITDLALVKELIWRAHVLVELPDGEPRPTEPIALPHSDIKGPPAGGPFVRQFGSLRQFLHRSVSTSLFRIRKVQRQHAVSILRPHLAPIDSIGKCEASDEPAIRSLNPVISLSTLFLLLFPLAL